MKKIVIGVSVSALILYGSSGNNLELLINVSKKLVTELKMLKNEISLLKSNSEKNDREMKTSISKLNLEIKDLKNDLNIMKSRLDFKDNGGKLQYFPNSWKKEETSKKIEDNYIVQMPYNQNIYYDDNIYMNSGTLYKIHFYLGAFKSKSKANIRLNKIKKIDKNAFIHKKSGRFYVELWYNGDEIGSTEIEKKLKRVVSDLFYKKHKEK